MQQCDDTDRIARAAADAGVACGDADALDHASDAAIPGHESGVGHDPEFGDDVPAAGAQPFWRTKSLEQMTRREWESLCDGCARCCLVKLEDEDTLEVHLTRLACRMLDHGSCRCSDYANRFARMPDCIQIEAGKVREIAWLPVTCAYRLVAEGRDLKWWHPLVSGSADTVHEAGISVRGWAISESKARPGTMHRYIIADLGE